MQSRLQHRKRREKRPRKRLSKREDERCFQVKHSHILPRSLVLSDLPDRKKSEQESCCMSQTQACLVPRCSDCTISIQIVSMYIYNTFTYIHYAPTHKAPIHIYIYFLPICRGTYFELWGRHLIHPVFIGKDHSHNSLDKRNGHKGQCATRYINFTRLSERQLNTSLHQSELSPYVTLATQSASQLVRQTDRQTAFSAVPVGCQYLHPPWQPLYCLPWSKTGNRGPIKPERSSAHSLQRLH